MRLIMTKGMVVLFSLLISSQLFARDEVIVIQAVSTTKKTFAVRKGFLDGVGVGQESLFTNKNVSLVAKVVEANRLFSVWEVRDPRARIPFEKGDFVTFTNSVENIWTEIPTLKVIHERISFRPKTNFIVRGTGTMAVNESVSETDGERAASRSGFQVGAYFARRFHPRFDYQIGMRIDQENARLTNPKLDIPTTRYIGMAELTFHFEPLPDSDNNIYIAGGAGWGYSQTRTDETTRNGNVFVLPAAKIGFQWWISAKTAMLIELGFEALSSNESFEDEQVQTTNIVNAKLTLGIKW